MRHLIACLALALSASLSPVHADHDYQFTGVVKSLDGDELVVEKSAKETWYFTLDPALKDKPAVGDRITVHYIMIAKSIEAKGKAAKEKAKEKKKSK